MTSESALELHNGLAQGVRKELASQLCGVLDAVYSLMVRIQVYHWNVEGPLFEPVHKLTEEQYTALFAAVDEIAERIRALDGKPAVNVNAFPTGVTNLPEVQTAASMIADLVRKHESVTRDMRPVVAAATNADDVVTADLLTGYIAQHEKAARSMLRGP